jgi:formylglycine-generating enzyme required for sulfatase activity
MSRKTRLALLTLCAIITTVMVGCDEDQVSPNPGQGTIIVNPEPASLNAPWIIEGPQGNRLSGNGAQTLTELAEGQYTVIWESVAGWISPSSSTEILARKGTVTFSGNYEEDPTYLPGHVLVPPHSVPLPATFTMGSTFEDDESPHQVSLTRRFQLSATEVTNAQYIAALQWAFDNELVTATSSYVQDNLDGSTVILAVLDSEDPVNFFNDGEFSTIFPDRPALEISWFGAAAYCDWLNLQAGLPRSYDHLTWSMTSDSPNDAEGFRLPTEAEWEFACRAGTTTPFNTGECLDSGSEANYDGNTPLSGCSTGPFLSRTADVGSYPANGWGLFDMHGNVWEWCNDWYGPYGEGETDPPGPTSGQFRVLRGGVWYNNGDHCRSAFRLYSYPNVTYDYGAGFRTARSSE